MEDKIKEAINLLRDNGYIVRKITERMQKDSDECEECGGGDCLGCSCSVCIMQ